MNKQYDHLKLDRSVLYSFIAQIENNSFLLIRFRLLLVLILIFFIRTINLCVFSNQNIKCECCSLCFSSAVSTQHTCSALGLYINVYHQYNRYWICRAYVGATIQKRWKRVRISNGLCRHDLSKYLSKHNFRRRLQLFLQRWVHNPLFRKHSQLRFLYVTKTINSNQLIRQIVKKWRARTIILKTANQKWVANENGDHKCYVIVAIWPRNIFTAR